MGNTSSGNKNSVLAVVGILTLSSGALGLAWLFYGRVNRATRFDVLTEKFYGIEELHSAIDVLRKEIEELKAIKASKREEISETEEPVKRSKMVRFKKTLSVLSSSDTEVTEYQSAWSGTEDSDEFYDFSENEEYPNEDSLVSSASHKEEALQIFEKVDSLLEGPSEDHESALQLLTVYETDYGNNVEFLWRMAKCLRMTAQLTTNESLKRERSFNAVEYAKRAHAADDSNAEAHKWMAISLGSIGDYLGVSDKIRNGFTFKRHIDKALEINPSDPLLHYLLGRFSYEVSMLSWIERKVATTLFTDIPSGSIEEAFAHFKNAEKLRNQPWKENLVFLARCCIQLNKFSEAIRWIDEAIPIPVNTTEDQTYQDELLSLQRKYSSYRC